MKRIFEAFLWGGAAIGLAILFAVAILSAQGMRLGVTAHSANLSWTASTVPTGAPPVTSYNVYRGTASGSETLLASAPSTSYTDSAVTPGTTYFYEVSGVNSAGESGKSNEVSGTIPNPVAPNPPTGLTATAQ